ncbi:MAG: hypothetical protein K2O91_17885 [Lachnospiraceae bacterium]|nr:hypothetical protein [Lachnospiraceae bacterium]
METITIVEIARVVENQYGADAFEVYQKDAEMKVYSDGRIKDEDYLV